MSASSEILKGLLNEKPFINRVIFGSSLKTAVKVVLKGGYKEVAVLGKDGDYLFCGKNIRDSLIENKIKADALIYDGEADLSLLIKGYAAIIAVGDSQTVLRASIACEKNGAICIAVPTKGVFGDLFAGKTLSENGALDLIDAPLPHKVILDDGAYKSFKKNDLADGFCFVASKIGQWAEYVLDCKLKAKTPDEEVKKLIEGGVSLLRAIKEANAHGVIFVSQIYLAKAVYLEPSLCFGGSFYVGQIISVLKGISVYEAINGTIEPLLEFYKFYLGLKNPFLAPNTNRDVEKLCEILKCSEIDVYKKYEPLSFDEISALKENLNENFDDIINNGISLIRSLKDQYKEVYRGRKRRDDFYLEDFKAATCYGGILSEGLLKLAYDDGVGGLLIKEEN